MPRSGGATDPLLLGPSWHVTLTSLRADSDGPRAVRPSFEVDAESLGVDLRIDSHRCVARFLASGETLHTATEFALQRWDQLRDQLGLPAWQPTSLVVTRAPDDSTVTPLRTAGRRCTPDRSADWQAPSHRWPYHVWSPC